jgi:hypothetical protein
MQTDAPRPTTSTTTTEEAATSMELELSPTGNGVDLWLADGNNRIRLGTGATVPLALQAATLELTHLRGVLDGLSYRSGELEFTKIPVPRMGT